MVITQIVSLATAYFRTPYNGYAFTKSAALNELY